MRRRLLLMLLPLAVSLGACGGQNDLLPTAPTQPSTTPSPTQVIARLNVQARDATSGARLDAWRRDVIVVLEAGAVCTDINLPCPRPEFVDWRLSGAFCELLGDRNAASVSAICSTTGIVRAEAVMPPRGFQPEARGEAQFRVLP